ncbi:cuticle protein 8 [Scaptodrosophila lebanonensis]|uniref:Cuticle protein 8 n=1 Tax=Drosophila lebanonensis TaxID=7225 RepID=A0A6J2UL42_DROLE|nr:cuticle protein 8-like [Scaptodrosophila lebanonensis]XP_030387947.1 cuticle protein 8 [Scaptodrosophila lebanonensis]
MKHLLILVVCVLGAYADVSHLSTTEPNRGPPNPYVFSYQAGRAPGHVDRQHTEVSDGSGVIRGAFSYVDPKNQVRTVQYVADENGFHPKLSHELEDSEAVKAAKRKHLALYHRIAQEHASQTPGQASLAAAPHASAAVVHATNKHLSEFERIAAEHAAIGAAQEAQRLALAAQSEHSDVDNGQYHP